MPSSASRLKSLKAQSTSRTPKPVEDAQREPVGAGVGRADERIGALRSGSRRRRPGLSDLAIAIEAGGQVGNPELAVAVGERDQVVACGAKPAAHGRAITLVDLVMNDPDARRRLAASRRRSRGVRVAAAIVDADDLELVGELGQLLQRLGDKCLDVLGFVMCRRRRRKVRRRVRAQLLRALRQDWLGLRLTAALMACCGLMIEVDPFGPITEAPADPPPPAVASGRTAPRRPAGRWAAERGTRDACPRSPPQPVRHRQGSGRGSSGRR